MSEQRYTLTLPEALYEELRKIAEANGASIKEIVRQCLKFGLVAIKIDGTPDSELIVREKKSAETGEEIFQETRLRFIL